MKYALGLVALMALLYVAHLFLARGAERDLSALRDIASQAPPPPAARSDLPQIVLDFARVNGAGDGGLARAARLRQEAEIEREPGGGFEPLSARQTILTGTPGFLWEAERRSGALTVFRIVDAYLAEEGRLTVRLLGSVPVVNARGPQIDLSEAMRYLAELPWAPDAILGNPDLVWRHVGPREVAVALALGNGGAATVTLVFDEAGDISEIRARDRPATGPGGETVLRDWRGVFREYGKIGGRRIPRYAEVGYIYEDGYRPYFRGRVTEYETVGPP